MRMTPCQLLAGQNDTLWRSWHIIWVSQVIAQKTANVRWEQNSASTWKLIDGSMETRQRCRKPCWHRNPRNVYRRPKGVRVAKRAGMSTTEQRQLSKAMVTREKTRNHTVSSTKLETSSPTAWGSRRSRRGPFRHTNFIKEESKHCFDLFKTKASRMFQSR